MWILYFHAKLTDAFDFRYVKNMKILILLITYKIKLLSQNLWNHLSNHIIFKNSIF